MPSILPSISADRVTEGVPGPPGLVLGLEIYQSDPSSGEVSSWVSFGRGWSKLIEVYFFGECWAKMRAEMCCSLSTFPWVPDGTEAWEASHLMEGTLGASGLWAALGG